MNPYVYLFGAIVLEVCGTMMLPFTENFTKPLPSVSLVVLYTASFYLMTFTLGANSAWGGLCHMERAWRVHRRFAELLSAQSEFELASNAWFGADCLRCDIGK